MKSTPQSWQDIETAPKDGATPLRLKTADGMEFNATYEWGFCNSDNEDCWCWVADDDNHPDDWTDGVCWAVNEDLKPSTLPIRWMPLPEPPE